MCTELYIFEMGIHSCTSIFNIIQASMQTILKCIGILMNQSHKLCYWRFVQIRQILLIEQNVLNMKCYKGYRGLDSNVDNNMINKWKNFI